MLIQVLAYDNANSECKKTIQPLKAQGTTLEEYLKVCQDIGSEPYKMQLLAQALSKANKKTDRRCQSYLYSFQSVCLKSGYQKWLSVVKESNDDKTSLFLLTALTFLEKEETSSMMNTPDFPDCVAEISHGIENWLQWKL